MKNKKRVLVAMSGGVDSSVAAALLVEQGYDVVGGFMHNWTGCDWEYDQRDALRVAASLDIPLESFNFEKEYRERVHDYMVDEYKAGRTPNPDVLCNSTIKFDLLIKEMERLNCNFLATGHYARKSENARLLKGVDSNKDQSYFLCRLNKDQLKSVLFPVGELKKEQVREKANEFGLATANKKDSQGLCFVGKVNFPEFLRERLKSKNGPIVNTEGDVIGEHDGVWFYTIGQRKGIGIGGTDPYYVVERRMDTNELVVAHENDPIRFSKKLIAKDVHWISGEGPDLPLSCNSKIRYRQGDQVCEVHSLIDTDLGIRVEFKEPQTAVSPGQFVVFYKDDELIGSAVIDKSLINR
jgi:tRNA-uridine 2-sulfurtransferase